MAAIPPLRVSCQTFAFFLLYLLWFVQLKTIDWDIPGGPVVKSLPCKVGGVGSLPGPGAKVPHASWPNSKRQNKQYFNKFNKDF